MALVEISGIVSAVDYRCIGACELADKPGGHLVAPENAGACAEKLPELARQMDAMKPRNIRNIIDLGLGGVVCDRFPNALQPDWRLLFAGNGSCGARQRE